MTVTGMAYVASFGHDVHGIDVLELPLPDRGFRAGCGEHCPLPRWAHAPDRSDARSSARYRWWIGHQATFCAWRQLAETLTGLAPGQGLGSALVEQATLLYDVYSLLLLYAGSCSRDVYETAIRADMARADEAFSGRWARDYELVPALVRGVGRDDQAAKPLHAAVKANRVVHMAVARRLVDGAESLLRKSGHGVDAPVTDHHRDLFDAFFHVRRADICRCAFEQQATRLYGLVLDDLDRAPLVVDHWAGGKHADGAAAVRCITEGPAKLQELLVRISAGKVMS